MDLANKYDNRALYYSLSPIGRADDLTTDTAEVAERERGEQEVRRRGNVCKRGRMDDVDFIRGIYLSGPL